MKEPFPPMDQTDLEGAVADYLARGGEEQLRAAAMGTR